MYVDATVTGPSGHQAPIRFLADGGASDEAPLGTVTLDVLGLVLNAFTRELGPMRAMLA